MMKTKGQIPTRDEILKMLSRNVYGGRILNNSHRGDLVEMMVLSALGSPWRFVGLGWHPWDLQRGSGADRVRIQVKQVAALQLWGPTKNLVLQFGWKEKPPFYFFRDNPDESIESEGWFCDLFVFGLHLVEDLEEADQRDPAQWRFLVVPVSDLEPRQNSVTLRKALQSWSPVAWSELAESVERVVRACRTAGKKLES